MCISLEADIDMNIYAPTDAPLPICCVDLLQGAVSCDVKEDIDAILWGMRLADIRRYFGQRFWEEETRSASQAIAAEPSPHLESVSEHSWHVADTALLLATNFAHLNASRCVVLAILHDKMELLIGDYDPLGPDGTGLSTHAFNEEMLKKKIKAEEQAISQYIKSLRPSVRREQERLLLECLQGRTLESRFVKAVDKIQALAFVLTKKRGAIELPHLCFTLRFSSKAVTYFPGLRLHYMELRSRLMKDAADFHRCSVLEIEQRAGLGGGVI